MYNILVAMENYSLSFSQALPFTFEELSMWYNGYVAHDGTKLYNPWSVAKALTERDLHSYWVESGDIIHLPVILLLILLQVMITQFLNVSYTCFRQTRLFVHK